MSIRTEFKHWKISLDQNNICFVEIDKQGTEVNVLSSSVVKELELLVNELQNNIKPKAIILSSAKSKGFIAGADISEFTKFETSDDAAKYIKYAQDVVNKFASIACTKVAVINGFCLGGGLELALACDYRVAVENSETKLGLPEVMLGIIPGWGGTVRLPRLIGVFAAMDLILTGKMVDARAAKKLGIVDIAVADRYIKIAALDYANKATRKLKPTKVDLLLNNIFMRKVLGQVLRKKLKSKVKEQHYPAPYRVVTNFEQVSPWNNEAFATEANGICDLIVTPTAKNLVRVFFLKERLKGFAKDLSDYKPKHVHVIGAGVMGGDIAAWCALSGFRVTLQDSNPAAIAATFKRAKQLFTKKLKLIHLVNRICDNLIPDLTGEFVAKADVVIEAIVENAKAKQDLFAKLEKMAKVDAILASNTSTIPLDEISLNMKNKDRVVGIHFFNPVALMQLVEVVIGKNTSVEVVKKAQAFVGLIGKLPLPVASKPGFLVNRVLVPYIAEAIKIYGEGVPADVIDKIALEFGMPMGPIELADVVGLDVCLAAGSNLGAELPKIVVDMINNKHLGKKTGQGFYSYSKNGKKQSTKSSLKTNSSVATYDKDVIKDRLTLYFVNETMKAITDKVVADADLADAGMIFGSGFAPFLGGPIEYAKATGYIDIHNRLNNLAGKYGERFTADDTWRVK